MSIAPKESAVLKACLELLRGRSIVHVCTNAGLAWAKDGKGGVRPIRQAEPGTADIIACVGGVFTAIECKRDDGKAKQSADQVEYERRVVAAGGRYVVVRSAAELMEKLEGLTANERSPK